MRKQILAWLLTGSIAIGTAGCGKEQQTNGTAGALGKITTTDTYPQKSTEKITYWMALHEHVAANYKSLNETPFAKGLIEATGINVEFVHPPQGQEAERFNLMIASDEMTDIVENWWMTAYSGGAEQAIQDKVIYRLNEAVDKISPNFKKYLEGHPQIEKAVITDQGSYFMYPFIREDSRLVTFRGNMVRKDLLTQVGETELPQTLSDYERVLYKFKAAGVKYPISIRLPFISTAFGGLFGVQNGDFFVENGVVKYGAYLPAYQDMLKLMAKWYRDGVLDKDFMDTDLKRLNSIVTSGDTGMVFGSSGGEFGLWLPVLKENMPNAQFVPVNYPVNVRGERPKFGQTGNLADVNGAAISAKSKNLELAVRLLDYGYSEAGHNYYNFGTEGVSYTNQDGVPTYTDAVINKEKNGNVSIGQGISRYARSTYFGPFVQDVNYIMQYYQMPEQKKALEIWSDTDAQKSLMPNVSLTLEESSECSRIMNDVNTLITEKVTKYINGQLDVNDMTSFYAELKKLGIERAVQIYQNAYDRYQQR